MPPSCTQAIRDLKSKYPKATIELYDLGSTMAKYISNVSTDGLCFLCWLALSCGNMCSCRMTNQPTYGL